MTEAYTDLQKTIRYYGRTSNGRIVENGAQIPFNFLLMDLGIHSKTKEFADVIQKFLDNLPQGEKIEANWVVNGNVIFLNRNLFHF